jgi:anaerobic selenocysteine-containing dehydrogenase
MNPEDAEQRGLVNGGLTEVRARAGLVQVEVELSEAMMPGVVCLPHGWGHGTEGSRMAVAAAHAGVGSNILTDDRVIDTASGNAVLNGIPVEVSRVG